MTLKTFTAIYQAQRNSVDKSICGDVNSIRFMFETKLDVMRWVHVCDNISDIGTKPNSVPTETGIIVIVTGICKPIYLFVKRGRVISVSNKTF